MSRKYLFTKAIAATAGVLLALAAPLSVPAEPSATPETRLNAPLGNAAPEPTLQTILDRLGYVIDVSKDEILSPLFERAGRGDVSHTPISAFGLLSLCRSGWYEPLMSQDIPPEKKPLWSVDGPNNKQDAPPLAEKSHTRFQPRVPFGLWVSTSGFKDETVYTQDDLQRFLPRFPAQDRHKVRVFPAKTKKGILKNTYILCWEYSTNNDFQDIVTRLENVRPVRIVRVKQSLLPKSPRESKVPGI